MKYNALTTSYREITVPVKQGILQIPLDSPCIEIIDEQILEQQKIDWQQLIDSKRVIVFLNEILSLTMIVKQLIDHGKPVNTKISLYGSDFRNRKQSFTGRLLDIEALRAEKKMMRVDMIIIGDLNLFTQNGYFKKKPLWGKKIITTRAMIQSYDLVRNLENLGATVFQFPLIDIKSSPDYDTMQAVLKRIETYEWIIFGMNMSVDYFIAFLLGSGYDLNCLKNSKICALSLESVERLTDLEIDLHYLPYSYKLNLDKVVEGLQKSGVNKEKPILILAEEDRGGILAEKLRNLQIKVDLIPIIRIECTEIDQQKLNKLVSFFPVDLWIFNGPFGIRELIRIFTRNGIQLKQSKIAAIGPETCGALEKEGLVTDIISKELTIPSLIEAIIDYYDNQEDYTMK